MQSFEATYRHVHKSGQLKKRVEKLKAALTACTLCPHRCGVDRTRGEKGKCQALDEAVLSEYGPHFGEEHPLVGKRGSGTLFFSHCNLQCVFCQNRMIAHHGIGETLSDERLAATMLELERYGCKNINVVTPTHFIANIVNAIAIAVDQGLSIPICYNTSGYESLDVLAILDGIVDLYLPDIKFFSNAAASTYFRSHAKDYPRHAKAAIKAMHKQVGDLVVDDRGNALRGVMIRHLVMPNQITESKAILDWIASQLSLETYVNIMSQYRPPYALDDYPEINRAITHNEYEDVMHYAKTLGLQRFD